MILVCNAPVTVAAVMSHINMKLSCLVGGTDRLDFVVFQM